MTKQEAAIAFAQGKKVQVPVRDSWANIVQWSQFDGPWEEFRLKPEPVPPGDLTYEQAVECIKRKEPLEVFVTQWGDSSANCCWDPDLLDKFGAYRRKPAPEIVPLGPMDVPPGSIVRLSGATAIWGAVLEVDRWSITAFTRAATVLDYLKLEGAYEISRDGGKTWQPCSKEENNG